MASPSRKLAAILSADVVGYSRLMGQDEVRTLSALRSLRQKTFEPVIATWRGTVIKRMGDGWLVEFASVVDAVSCAMEVQKELAAEDVIKIRMGIHIGDIVHEDEDIYGDGVNIASRLQEQAAPGGIAISAFAHDSLDAVVRSGFHSRGTAKLKNISQKIEIYGWGEEKPKAIPSSSNKRGELPSVLVLPFGTSVNNAESDMLAEGLTDAIIMALSRFSWFKTLPRNTSNQYNNQRPDVSELRRKHSVSYVLESTLRAAGSRARISSELIDARTGNSVWADQFDGASDDPFELEDKITRAILAELTPRIVGAEERRVRTGGDGSAWDLMMQGRSLLWRINKDNNERAQEFLLKAISLEPKSGLGQSDLAWSYVYQRIYGWTEDLDLAAQLAVKAGNKAIDADDSDAYAFVAAAMARCLVAQSDHALALARRAVSLNSNLAAGYGALSLALFQNGEYEDAENAAKQARELSPRDPLRAILMGIRGINLLLLDRIEQMTANAEEIIRDFPDMPTGWRQLAVAYAKTGRPDEANALIDNHVLRLIPGLTATLAGQQVPIGNNEEARKCWVDGLVEAGLPK
jgi:adenylate cyclase